MVREYNWKEASEILDSLRKMPNYQGYELDKDVGFYRGPYSGIEIGRTLTENEAAIGVRQPISRMAQHDIVLVEKNSRGEWKFKDVLNRRETA